jgi:hypothetical protein
MKYKRHKYVMHILRLVVNCTVAVTQFTSHASCSKWPPIAWIYFLTHVTTEYVTLHSTAALFICLIVLTDHQSSFSHTPCTHTSQRSYNPTHGNLTVSDAVTMMVSSRHGYK